MSAARARSRARAGVKPLRAATRRSGSRHPAATRRDGIFAGRGLARADQPAWSSVSAADACRFTESIPFRAAALVVYASLEAITWPLAAKRLNRNCPPESFFKTNLPAMWLSSVLGHIDFAV